MVPEISSGGLSEDSAAQRGGGPKPRGPAAAAAAAAPANRALPLTAVGRTDTIGRSGRQVEEGEEGEARRLQEDQGLRRRSSQERRAAAAQSPRQPADRASAAGVTPAGP